MMVLMTESPLLPINDVFNGEHQPSVVAALTMITCTDLLIAVALCLALAQSGTNLRW
jgi:hypothetical protein